MSIGLDRSLVFLLSIVVLWIHNDCFVLSSSCIYSGGIKSGSCNGIIESSIALRNDLASFNRGCPINSVFYYPNSTTFVCGECIPTTLLYSSIISNYKINICKQTAIGRVCEDPQDASLLNDYQCPIGDYCTEDGTCKPLSLHPLVGETCTKIEHPFTYLSLKNLCGFDGLQCIHGVCQVCQDGIEYTPISPDDYTYIQSKPIFTRTKDNRKSRRYCVNSKLYPTKYDYTFLSDPTSVFVLSFCIVVVLIVVARDCMKLKNSKLAQKFITRLKLFRKSKKSTNSNSQGNRKLLNHSSATKLKHTRKKQETFSDISDDSDLSDSSSD